MRKKDWKHRLIRGIYNYMMFFFVVAFLVSCTTILFATILAKTTSFELTSANIGTAAKATFLNVLLLSVLFTVIDAVRRKLTTERITKQIADAANKMVQGDFTMRIARVNQLGTDEKFNEIIDCFNAMAEELSGVETLRTDFIANVSHELKTPLAVIQNYASMLQNPAIEDEKQVEYAKNIVSASKRLTDLITNILKLNRLENQQIYPETTVYDLGEQICECMLNFEEVWEKKNLELDVKMEEDIHIKADAELMTLVWNNLFSNAVKFTEPGGKITIGIKKEEEKVVVTVADTGCGIAPEVGQHIFEKFYQGDTSHAVQGNGLGLALVKRVIDITGGEISVQSKLGEGTTFKVILKAESI